MEKKHIIELRLNEADDFVTILLDGKETELDGWDYSYCEHVFEVINSLEAIFDKLNGEPFEIIITKED